ncbi:MAG: T9SS type A sorting domain-containing protein [Saprospiraceae bacterium]|nr:T9SS type A sorting domain-containing protein [Saprospiraceae bacterium]
MQKYFIRLLMFGMAALAFAPAAFAQTYVHQVLILNEGYYDYQNSQIVTPVTVGAYNPTSGVYTTVNTIEGARFASDIKVYGDFYYVAADNKLLKFDRNTHAEIASQAVPGIRKIAVSDNLIVATRGEYLVDFDAYVRIFDAETLALVHELTTTESGIFYPTEGVLILNNKAYIAINNGFDFGNEVGELAVVNLADYAVEQIYSLGPEGKNPDNLMFDGEKLYTLNNKDFSGSSVSAIALDGTSLTTTNLEAVSSGCGTSALFEDAILYQELGNTKVGKFDPASQSTVALNEYGKVFYGMAADPTGPFLYAAETDYVTFGEVFIYDAAGNITGSFEAGVSPGNIAFDVRNVNDVAETKPELTPLSVFPNPVTDLLTLHTDLLWNTCEITDARGQKVSGGSANGDQTLPVQHLPAGIYVVRLYGENGQAMQRFVKR